MTLDWKPLKSKHIHGTDNGATWAEHEGRYFVVLMTVALANFDKQWSLVECNNHPEKDDPWTLGHDKKILFSNKSKKVILNSLYPLLERQVNVDQTPSSTRLW